MLHTSREDNTVAGIRTSVDEGIASESLYSYAYYPFLLLWVFALVPKELCILSYGLLAVVMCYLASKRKHFRVLPASFTLIVGFLAFAISIYCFAIAAAVVREYNFNRLLAALNTLAIWVVAAIYFIFYLKLDCKPKLITMSRYCFANSIVLIALLILYAVDPSLSFSNGLEHRHLSIADYLDAGQSVRFVGFLDYSTLVVMMLFIIYPLAIYYCASRYSLPVALSYGVVSFLPAIATSSRAAVLFGCVLVAISLIFVLLEKSITARRYRVAITVLITLLLIIVAIAHGSELADTAISILNKRSDSTAGRMYLYDESIRLVFDESPVFGLGIKYTSLLTNDAPLGSHSTWVGFLYKTGILGFLLYLSVFVLVIIKLAKVSTLTKPVKRYFVLCAILFMAYLAIEDLDGVAWACITWFSIVAVLISPAELRSSCASARLE